MDDCLRKFYISNTVRMFFSTPFWSSAICTGIHPHRREKHMKAACQRFNEKDKTEGDWVYRELKHPRPIRKRKAGLIYKSVRMPEAVVGKIENLLGHRHGITVHGRICYVDYGLGSFELFIDAEKDETEEFSGFIRKCSLAKDEVVENFLQKGAAGVSPSLYEINRLITGFFDKKGILIPNHFNKQSDDVATEEVEIFCGPVARHMLFFRSGSRQGACEVDLKQIELASKIMIDQSTRDYGRTGSITIPVCHVGFEGAVALLDDEESLDILLNPDGKTPVDDGDGGHSNLEHVQLLWSWAIIYWSALFAASEGLFTLSTTFSFKESFSLKKLNQHIEFLDTYRKIISMIKFESRPEKVIAEGEDTILYMKLWHAYRSEELLKSLAQIDADSGKMITSLRQKANQLSQKKIRHLFGALTVISLFEVVSNFIQLYDFNNTIPSLSRIRIVVITGFLLILAGLLYLGVASLRSRLMPYDK